MTDPSECVLSYETPNMRTDVIRLSEAAYQWRQTPGRLNIVPRIPVSDASLGSLAVAGTDHIEFAVANRLERGLAFDLVAPVSVGWQLLSSKVAPGQVADLVVRLGEALRKLHEQPLPSAAVGVGAPRRLLELAEWLRHGVGSMDEPFLHVVVAEKLGLARWKKIQEWCEELLTRKVGLCHGACTLGNLVVDRQFRFGQLLSGPDVGLCGPELDIGRFLAEVPAYSEISGMMEAGLDTEGLARSFLLGYGDFDGESVGRSATVMFLAGMRHIAAHIGWKELINGRVGKLADLIDETGKQLLPG